MAGMLDQILTEVVPRYNGFSGLRVGILGVPSLLMWGGALLGSPSSYEVFWVTFLAMFDMTDVLVSVSEASFVRPPVWQLSNLLMWLASLVAITATEVEHLEPLASKAKLFEVKAGQVAEVRRVKGEE